MYKRIGILLALPCALSGCSFISALVDQGLTSAGDRAGNIIGEKVGNQVGRSFSTQMDAAYPQLAQAYAMGLFSMLYYHGGYSWDAKPYKPGEYTQWQGNLEQGQFFEKAFLKREADGREWWRVRSVSTEDGNKEEAIFEALFSVPNADGVQKIVRMRAKLPDQTKGAEIPITKDNQSMWMLTPTARLTPESLQGATVGVEQIKVPAGSFKAKHVRYMHGASAMDWWLADNVPGGVVKYVVGDKDEKQTVQLVKVGTGAKPQL